MRETRDRRERHDADRLGPPRFARLSRPASLACLAGRIVFRSLLEHTVAGPWYVKRKRTIDRGTERRHYYVVPL